MVDFVMRPSRPTVFERFIESCVLNNVYISLACYRFATKRRPFLQGGIIDENEDEVVGKLNQVIQKLTSTLLCNIYIAAYLSSTTGTFLDPQKAADDLHAFAKLNEGRLYKLFNTCMDTQTDLKALTKATVSSVSMPFTFHTHDSMT